jgi:hypothetical protein
MVPSCWNPPAIRSSSDREDRICTSTCHCCLSRTPLLTNTEGNTRTYYALETVKQQSASSQKANNVRGMLLPKAPDVPFLSTEMRTQEEDLIKIYVMQREWRERATTQRHPPHNDRGCYTSSSGAPTVLWSAKTAMNDTQTV